MVIDARVLSARPVNGSDGRINRQCTVYLKAGAATMRLWDMQGNEIKELKGGVACLDVSIVDDGGEMVEE